VLSSLVRSNGDGFFVDGEAEQCVAVFCSVLQRVAVCSIAWQLAVMVMIFFYDGEALQYLAVCCSVLQRVAVCHCVLQRVE